MPYSKAYKLKLYWSVPDLIDTYTLFYYIDIDEIPGFLLFHKIDFFLTRTYGVTILSLTSEETYFKYDKDRVLTDWL